MGEVDISDSTDAADASELLQTDEQMEFFDTDFTDGSTENAVDEIENAEIENQEEDIFEWEENLFEAAETTELSASWKIEPSRDTYVQGGSFYVDGTVQYEEDGKTKTIKFTDALVKNGYLTITGYDMEKLGEQTVTYVYENDTIKLTLTDTITVKLPQAAPEGITAEDVQVKGGQGKILGTTTAMEYSRSQYGGEWFPCTDGETIVPPYSYSVRYAETEDKAPGETVRVNVGKYVEKIQVVKEGKEETKAKIRLGESFVIKVEDYFEDPEGEPMRIGLKNESSTAGNIKNWTRTWSKRNTQSDTLTITPKVAGETYTGEVSVRALNNNYRYSKETAKFILTCYDPIPLDASWKIEPSIDTYVQGGSFYVDGTVQYEEGGKTKTIKFTDALVKNGYLTITGYDMEKLGEQTVTYVYENDTIRLTLTDTITVKLPQAAPEGITTEGVQVKGGKGKILGTTTAMEYSLSEYGGEWFPCTEGETIVPANSYSVRYAETEDKAAGATVRVHVGKYVEKVQVVKEGKEETKAKVRVGESFVVNVEDYFEDPEGDAMSIGVYKTTVSTGSTKNWTRVWSTRNSKNDTITFTPKAAGETYTVVVRATNKNSTRYSTEMATIILTSFDIVELDASWKTEPSRSTYVQGGSFYVDGIVQYEQDGKTKTITFSDTLVKNGYLTVTGYDMEKLGEQTVTYVYENDTIKLTLTDTITVKLPQAAPEGITTEGVQVKGGQGKILGTTTAMEYSLSEYGGEWFPCTEGETIVPANSYSVRYAETEDKAAGATVRVHVAKYVNKVPVVKEGKEKTEAKVRVGESFVINVEDYFEDPEDETMKLLVYSVSSTGSTKNWTNKASNNNKTITITPLAEGEVYTLVVRAQDSNTSGYSTEMATFVLTSYRLLEVDADWKAEPSINTYTTGDSFVVDGTVEYVENGEIKTLELNPELIEDGYLTVTGYDMDTAGEQEVTYVYNDGDVTFTITKVIKVENPKIYGITLNPAGDKSFGELEEGYAQPNSYEVTVMNSGNCPTNDISITLSGKNADSFQLSSNTVSSIAVDGKAVFTVAPKTGLKAGEYQAVVTVSKKNAAEEGVSAQQFSVSFQVKAAEVKEVKAEAVTLNKTSLSLEYGKSSTLKATVTPSNTANKSVTWKSSDTSVATVSADGVVKAKGTGKAVITCTVNDGSQKQAKCTVTVKDSTVFMAQATASGTSVKLKWTKIPSAAGYEVYGNVCGKDYKKVKTVNKNSTTSVTLKKLKGKEYKYYIRAYKLVNGKKVYIKTSKKMHVVVNRNSYTNPTKITVSTKNITLKAGKSKKISAKITKKDKNGKLLTHTSKFRYSTSNSSVAKVSASGKITAKGKGTCNIYIVAANGVYSKVKVTVK